MRERANEFDAQVREPGVSFVTIFTVDQRLELIFPADATKTRLEDFLFERFPGLSRMYLRRLVKEEKCEVNGRLENVGYRLRGGDFLEVELDLTRENSMRPENVPLDIVFEDEHLIVVNKPAGMLVHPTNRDKNGTLLNALVFYFNHRSVPPALAGGMNSSLKDGDLIYGAAPPANAGGTAFIRPGLVHRLDKQTSGLMVIAKTLRAHRSLSAQFQKKYVEKKYHALVEGLVKDDSGTIDSPVARFAHRKQWDVNPDGKHAETKFVVKERGDDTTLLELEPVTGRTNQLRIHCASIGHPIVGEVTRGAREWKRLCLHAWKLSIRHPITREDMQFESLEYEF